jgi:glyoxylase-like metal-dependent hydrolase (beta-lactamase superfamily II)
MSSRLNAHSRRFALTAIGATIALSLAGCASYQTATLQSAADTLNASGTQSIEFTGTGRWYQFGQAPAPQLAWPPFDVSSYTADINYATPSARVQIVRKQVIESGRDRPAPVEQRPDQYVSGGYAWNVAPGAGGAVVATAQPAALEERRAEIWSTPQGFIKAALANQATVQSGGFFGGTEVSFTVGGKYRYVGTLNSKSQVESIKTWIDNPILGDTLVETTFSDYADFGGVPFPRHIVRTQGGYPVLDINVSGVKLNPAVAISAPQDVVSAKPVVNVVSTKLADGVFYLTGGTHHSVAIEQRDHVVVVEGPLNEDRSVAVIAKVKEVIPGKPIKYLVNTHAHFDHSGGVRTFVNEGATIVTHKDNQSYYEQAWAAPRSINPDLLAKSGKAAKFETFTAKHVLTDGQRSIELYPLEGNSHNDAFVAIYLPKEKILIEVDAYTPLAANQQAPTSVNPYAANLYDNIKKQNLDVQKIAALHGPGVVGLADLRSYIGAK